VGQILFDAIAVHLPRAVLNAMINLPTSAFRALRTAKLISRREGWRLVREKLQAPEGSYESDIYSLLLHPEDEDGKRSLKPEELVAQTSLILLAGQDTTSNTLAFGLLELARRPLLQTKLRNEITSTITGPGGNVAYDNMPLLNAFIKETLRMSRRGTLRACGAPRVCDPARGGDHHQLWQENRRDPGG